MPSSASFGWVMKSPLSFCSLESQASFESKIRRWTLDLDTHNVSIIVLMKGKSRQEDPHEASRLQAEDLHPWVKLLAFGRAKLAGVP